MPASDVPGEKAAQSQPFPTKPKAFAKQGFGLGDLIDFTPEIRARALEETKSLRFGPIFTPPSMAGTIVMPGAIGGAGWGGGALDPSSGTIYIKASNSPAMYKIVQPAHSDTVDADYSADLSASNLRVAMPPRDSGQRFPGLIFATGGGSTLYAIDSRDGSTLWSADLGQNGYAVPMTYRTKAGKQFVVIATGAANGAKLQAFALP